MFRYVRPGALGLLTISLLSSAALAQTTALPDVVISANQFPLEADRVGSTTTVLQGEKLRADGFTNLAEALRFVPGVHVAPSGGSGTLTQVRIRGGEANHLLVMIDGIEVNQLQDSGFDFADFPLDDVERVEVIRGPQSGIYGANAHSGVISIITRSGRGLTSPRLDARLEGGNLNTRNGSINLRGAVGAVYGSFTFTGFQTDGYNFSRFGNEKDGSRATTATFKGGIDVTPDLNIEGVLRYTDRYAYYDPQAFGGPFSGYVVDGNANGGYESLIGRIGATWKLFGGRFVQSMNAKYYDQNSIAYENGFLSFGTSGQRSMLDYKATVLGDTNMFGGERHTLTFLVDQRRETYQSVFDPLQFLRQRTGIAGEYVIDLPTNTTISTALRHDWNSNFDDVVTWRIALSQRFAGIGGRLHTSAGKGITDPTFAEVAGSAFNTPNFLLRPEQSTGWDIGWEQQFLTGRIVTDVTYFETRLTDEIYQPVFPLQYVNNPGIAERKGVELTGKFQWFDWLSTSASYTYTDAETRTGLRAQRRPPHSAAFDVTALFADGRGRLTFGATYNGKRTDVSFVPSDGGSVVLPGAFVARAQISYDLTKNATAYIKAENLFDHRYEDIYTYRAAPFTVLAGLKVRLGDNR